MLGHYIAFANAQKVPGGCILTNFAQQRLMAQRNLDVSRILRGQSFCIKVCPVAMPSIASYQEVMEKEEQSFGKFSCSAIFNYLKNGSYPEGYSKSEKGSLRKRAKFFFVKEAELFYRSRSTSTDEPTGIIYIYTCMIDQAIWLM